MGFFFGSNPHFLKGRKGRGGCHHVCQEKITQTNNPAKKLILLLKILRNSIRN
jgi:hypothetical protein